MRCERGIEARRDVVGLRDGLDQLELGCMCVVRLLRSGRQRMQTRTSGKSKPLASASQDIS
jgi:hypothetical protein